MINYVDVIDKWYDKVIKKADSIEGKLDSYGYGTEEYNFYMVYSKGLYLAISMMQSEIEEAEKEDGVN